MASCNPRAPRYELSVNLSIKPYFRRFSVNLSLLAVTLITISSIASPDQANRLARKQTTVPAGYTEMPFVETAAKPTANAEEKKRGYMLFTRPITEPVHTNTHPLPSERLTDKLSAFATPGEWEPVTLSIYPLRELKNFRLQVSELVSPDGNKITSSQITVRL